MEEYNTHDFRELRIRNEERPFLHHEGPFLVSRRACSRTLKGVFHNLEWPPLYLRTMKIAYKHTLLNPPKQRCLIHNPAQNCPHLLPVSPPTHSSSSTKSWYITTKSTLYRPHTHFVLSTKSWYIISKPNLCRPQPHFASSTSSFCIIRCPIVSCLLTHPALSLNPSYIASAPTFSTRSPKAFFFTTHKKRRSKKLLSFTSSSLISISRSTPLMCDYP